MTGIPSSGSPVPIRALIADDEAAARRGLRRLLALEAPWVTVAGEASSGPAAVEAIDATEPDLVFLDIEMPGFSGTDVLRRIRHRPHVVFTTAYSRHAVTAFELGAVDYLLKPFGAERLALALERIRVAREGPASIPAADRLRETLGAEPIGRLFVRAAGGVVPVAVERIDWFEARGDYVAAHVGPARHLLSVSLNELEARLDPDR
ncbi:MAG: LytR/AlgR family response regulator transcription factor, partial [Gemmatimonadales bacterium]